MPESTNPGGIQIIIDGVTVFDSTQQQIPDQHIIDLIQANLPPILNTADVQAQLAAALSAYVLKADIEAVIQDALQNSANIKKSISSIVAADLTN